MKRLFILLCIICSTVLVGCREDGNFKIDKSTTYVEEVDKIMSNKFKREKILDKNNALYIEYSKYYDKVVKYFDKKGIRYYLDEISYDGCKFDVPISVVSIDNLNNIDEFESMYYDLAFGQLGKEDPDTPSYISFNVKLNVKYHNFMSTPFEGKDSMIADMKDIVGANNVSLEQIARDINSYYLGYTTNKIFYYDGYSNSKYFEQLNLDKEYIEYNINIKL